MRSLLSLAAALDLKRGSSQSLLWMFSYATLVRFTNVQALLSWLHSHEAGEKVDGFFRRMRSHSPLIQDFSRTENSARGNGSKVPWYTVSSTEQTLNWLLKISLISSGVNR